MAINTYGTYRAPFRQNLSSNSAPKTPFLLALGAILRRSFGALPVVYLLHIALTARIQAPKSTSRDAHMSRFDDLNYNLNVNALQDLAYDALQNARICCKWSCFASFAVAEYRDLSYLV